MPETVKKSEKIEQCMLFIESNLKMPEQFGKEHQVKNMVIRWAQLYEFVNLTSCNSILKNTD